MNARLMVCSHYPTPTPIKKWVQLIYAELFTLADKVTDTDANRLQIHFVGVCVGVGQCEHYISLTLGCSRRNSGKRCTVAISST